MVATAEVAPSRARGLKRWSGHHRTCYSGGVAPSRARGLKHITEMQGTTDDRRALTGAWIETIIIVGNPGEAEAVAPSRARGLKLGMKLDVGILADVAPSRARGLKLLRYNL